MRCEDIGRDERDAACAETPIGGIIERIRSGELADPECLIAALEVAACVMRKRERDAHELVDFMAGALT